MNSNNDFQRFNVTNDEELIQKALNYLKYEDPTNANREEAISLLLFMQDVAKELSTSFSGSFDDYFDMYKSQ
jgi:hypothetical protein